MIEYTNIYEKYPIGVTYYDYVGLNPNKFMPNSKWKLLFTFAPLDSSKNLQKIYVRIE